MIRLIGSGKKGSRGKKNGGMTMRIRRWTGILLALLLIATAIAAGAETVSDDSVFEQELGIRFAGQSLNGGDVQMRIIEGNIGEVSYLLEDVNGNNVRWTIRFTRNQGYASAGILSGISENRMTEPVDLSGNGINLSLRTDFNAGKDLYFWNYGRNCFCLIINGLTYSQMQYGAQMDQIIAACN